MFAVIKTGGKQYKVAEGTVLKIEKLEGDAGTNITIDEVLACGTGKTIKIGTPTVKGASVTLEVLEQKKDDKVIVFKKKRRHNYRRKKGHRQHVTIARVVGISDGKAKKTEE